MMFALCLVFMVVQIIVSGDVATTTAPCSWQRPKMNLGTGSTQWAHCHCASGDLPVAGKDSPDFLASANATADFLAVEHHSTGTTSVRTVGTRNQMDFKKDVKSSQQII